MNMESDRRTYTDERTMLCARADGRVDLEIMIDLKRHLNAAMTPIRSILGLAVQ
jgi:hypothetical protein